MHRFWAAVGRGVKTFVRRADMLLLTLCLLASGYGLLLITSATKTMSGSRNMLLVQGAAIALGVLLFAVFTLIDIEIYAQLWKWLLLFNIVFLGSLFFFGFDPGTGNRSWLSVPLLPFNIQPGEIVKITFILLLAKHFDALSDNINKPWAVLSLLAHIGFMAALILFVSDDMGLAVVYLFIFVIVAFCSNLHIGWILAGVGSTLAALPLVWNFLLQPYQKERILNILEPTRDLLGVGWQANQSKIAISAGGLTGLGLFQGPQTQNSRLPFKHTDFIFSVAGEELGLIGCLVIFVLLLAIIVRCLTMSLRAKDMYGKLVCVGIGSMLVFQTFENIGMCLGILPVIGLTLPFFSYGGSSIVTLFAAMGLISSVKMHPKKSWLEN